MHLKILMTNIKMQQLNLISTYMIFKHLQINSNVALSSSELPIGSFVEGLSSGATGFAVGGGRVQKV